MNTLWRPKTVGSHMSISGLFSGNWGDAGDPGYGLTTLDVTNFRSSLVGVPVTVNHAGLESVIGTLDKNGIPVTKESFDTVLQNTAKGSARSVGKIVQAGPGTDVLFTINKHFGGLQELVRNGIFNGLSLTHVETSGEKQPLELTLCSDPARSGATVGLEYKPIALEALNVSMSTEQQLELVSQVAASDAAAPELTKLESVMSRLSEADQAVVLERLGEADKTFASLKGEISTANKMIAERDADSGIVKDQIAYLRTLLEQNGASVESDRLEDVNKYLDHKSLPHTHMALERVVQACSRALAANSTVGQRAPKRRAVETAPVTQKAPAAPAVNPSGSSSTRPETVRNLLRSHFDSF